MIYEARRSFGGRSTGCRWKYSFIPATIMSLLSIPFEAAAMRIRRAKDAGILTCNGTTGSVIVGMVDTGQYNGMTERRQ